MFCALVAASLAAVPVQPPQVSVRAIFASVDIGYAEQVGWYSPGEIAKLPGTAWDTETAAIVRTAKAAEKFEVFSRPSLLLVPEQTGFFQSGGTRASHAVTLRVTPTLSGDAAAVTLAVDLKHVHTVAVPLDGMRVSDTEAAEATCVVPFGKTACVRAGTAEGKKTVRLLFLTADLVKPAAATAAAEVAKSPIATVAYTVSIPLPTRNPFVTPTAPIPVVLKPVPEPTTLPELLAAYRNACERQDKATAARFAGKALALDPTCFK